MTKHEAEALAKQATTDGHPARICQYSGEPHYLVVKRRTGDFIGYRVYSPEHYARLVATDFGRRVR